MQKQTDMIDRQNYHYARQYKSINTWPELNIFLNQCQTQADNLTFVVQSTPCITSIRTNHSIADMIVGWLELRARGFNKVQIYYSLTLYKTLINKSSSPSIQRGFYYLSAPFVLHLLLHGCLSMLSQKDSQETVGDRL